MSNYNQPQNSQSNQNQSLDYESWVNSLGNVQDGIFQNTPISNHILQSINNSSQLNILSNTPTGVGASSGLGNIPSLSNPQDLNMDLFFNSPERFYRDIINESPVINRTPMGRTPLRNLSVNFNTPNFLKNIETTTKLMTPLKNQLFNSNEIFQTPNQPQNSTLNSSPTTIKINSSAVKHDDQNKENVIIPPSPTPASKIFSYDQAIPKMGYFKQSSPKEMAPLPPRKKPQQNKFQIIMTDVNSFANSSKGTKKKKKLTRSSTQPSIKKPNLKRSLSQPSKNLQNNSLVQDLFDHDLQQGKDDER